MSSARGIKTTQKMKAALIAALLGCAASGIALSSSALGAEPVVIGMAVAKSGMFQPYDAEGIKMAELFIDQINAKGGLLGQPLKAVVADSKSDRVEGAKAGSSVLQQGAKVVVVTCDYDFGAPAAMQAGKAGVIAVSLCAGDPKMGPVGVGPYAFSATAAAQTEGVKLATWAIKERKFKNAYMLVDTTIEYTKSVCSGFEWAWQQQGGKLVGRDTFRNADPSLATQITRLSSAVKNDGAEVVMVCSFLPGGATALRQIRAAGIDVPIMSGQAMAGTYWLASVPNLSNFYSVMQASVLDDPRPAVKTLVDAYKAKHGEAMSQVGAFPIYAWLQLWAKAVQQAGTFDSAKVLAVMNTFKDEPTFLGPYSYTPKLHIQDKAEQVIAGVQNGKQAEIHLTKPAVAVPENVLYRKN